jgi:hypothetical protein
VSGCKLKLASDGDDSVGDRFTIRLVCNLRFLLIRPQTIEAASLALTRPGLTTPCARRRKSKLTRAAQQHDNRFQDSYE